MYFLIAAPDQDTLAIVKASQPPQFDSETITVFRLVQSNKPLWRQFEGILSRYHAVLKDRKGVTLESDGTITVFHHDFT